MSHLESHDLLPDRRSAYRKDYSTETSILRLFDRLHRTADNGGATALLFLDLSAAFNTIDHTILLDRLSRRCGVTGAVLSWFGSYLLGRTQVVKIGEFESSTSPIYFGVP